MLRHPIPVGLRLWPSLYQTSKVWLTHVIASRMAVYHAGRCGRTVAQPAIFNGREQTMDHRSGEDGES